LPFKLNQHRRHHIPKQKRKVMNWREYEAWFNDGLQLELS